MCSRHHHPTMHLQLCCIPLLLLLGTVIAAPTPPDPDFVIVGGGTAGCVLAARLCDALPSANIVLLERGVERNATAEFLVRSPRNAVASWASPAVSEFFESEPDPGILGRKSIIVTGNTLGGSSSINGMQWTIPLGNTVSRWRIQGLSSRSARPFFRRAYDKVGFSQQPLPLSQIYGDDYVEAAKRAGFRNKFDPFDQKFRKAVWQMSVAVTPTGRRIDSCTAYLTPALQVSCGDNLEVIQGVTVTRVLLDDSKPPRATGVEYVLSSDTGLNNKIVVHAAKEVILSAGPYGSPKLLQLSGIGRRDHLLRANVQPRVDLPVGERTQSRPLNFLLSLYLGVPLEPSNNSTVLGAAETLQKWESGEASAFGTTGSATHGLVRKAGYSTMVTAFDMPMDVPIMGTFCLANPAAFGYLRIRDANPFSPPEVFLNILGAKAELKRLDSCLRQFSRVHAKIPKSFQLEDVVPAMNMNDTFLRESTTFAYHYVGGCSVGAVVRPNLSVRGVDGLRVIDASVFKTIPSSAGPMSSTYMLAEYVSEKIANKYRCEFGTCPKYGTRRKSRGW